jgi:hypothetical protein
METTLIFGTFTNPLLAGSVSFSCPAILSEENMKQIKFSDEPALLLCDTEDEVTHTVFFGENLKRVAKAIKGE